MSTPNRLLILLLLVTLTLGLPQVRLGSTVINGRDIGTFQQEFFGGVPFAEPPVGQLRFAPPVLKSTLSGSSFDASDFGAACPQASGNVSEDCLTINILRPSGVDSTSRLPVVAWVFGGGFYKGSASQFNGSNLVSRSVQRGTPIIYVNFNYRLGALGFPQGIEAARRGATNLGLKDVHTALRWVQNNIKAFGGDPEKVTCENSALSTRADVIWKVTVFGQSAGSISIAQLFLSPTFGELAHAAIFHSGSAASLLLFNSTARESDWQNFVSQVPECDNAPSSDTFDCLRRANFSTILPAMNTALREAPEEFPFVPVIDGLGGVLPDYPSKLYQSGSFARIPFISGNVKDEGTIFIPYSFDSESELRQWIMANNTPLIVPTQMEDTVADRILQLYPDNPALGSPFDTGNDTFGLSSEYKRAAAYMGDMAFISQRRIWTQVASSAGMKVFGYLFTDPQPQNPPSDGVSHASDIPYIYGQVVNGSDSANQLSVNMMDYYVSFATSLDPNDKHGNTSRPVWTQYTPHTQNVIQLNGQNLTMIPDTFRKDQMAYIISNPAAFHHR